MLWFYLQTLHGYGAMLVHCTLLTLKWTLSVAQAVEYLSKIWAKAREQCSASGEISDPGLCPGPLFPAFSGSRC